MSKSKRFVTSMNITNDNFFKIRKLSEDLNISKSDAINFAIENLIANKLLTKRINKLRPSKKQLIKSNQNKLYRAKMAIKKLKQSGR